MHRLLIADAGGSFGSAVQKQLKEQFEIEKCCDGESALRLLREFEPDIMLLDLQLPQIDGLTVLRSLRSANMNTKVIVITPLASEYVCVQLQMLGVVGLFLKPCLLGAVVNCIRDVQMQLLDADNDWCVEDEVDRILLNLGFSMGRSGYCFTRDALMYKFVNPNASATKCVYPDVAKRFGGTSTQVEKAIRDAIKFAWKNGNVQVWQMYFPPGNHMQTECPSNEVFLNRIAMILTSKTRIRKPYQKAGLIAK